MNKIYKNHIRNNPIDLFIITFDNKRYTYHCYSISYDDNKLILSFLRRKGFTHMEYSLKKISCFYSISYFNKDVPMYIL